MNTVGPCALSSHLEGCRVRLRTDSCEIEGTVHNVNSKTSRISLKKITDASSNATMAGVMHFYADDISSCVVLENSTKQKRVSSTKEEDGPRLLRIRPIPPHLERLNMSVGVKEFICHRLKTDNPEDDVKRGYIKLVGEGDQVPIFKIPLPTKFQLVDEMDETFHEALNVLKNQTVIGIGYDGFKIGRSGCLSLLAVSTADTVYLFDILVLKNDPFDQGLKEILESKDIEKVIHGCRQISDCLYHLFQVELDNIFDTQVADVVVFRNQNHYNRGGDVRGEEATFVRGLQYCLKVFLGFSHDQLKYTRSRQNPEEEDTSAWRQRPLSLSQIDSLVKDVIYLRELRLACLDKLLRDFRNGVRYFQSLVRDCSEPELEFVPPEHVLPPGFYNTIRMASKSQGHGQEWSAQNGHGNFHRQDRRNDHMNGGGRRFPEPWGRQHRYYHNGRSSHNGGGGGRPSNGPHGDTTWRHKEEPRATVEVSSPVPDPEDSLFMMPPTPPRETTAESEDGSFDSAATELQLSTPSESDADGSSQSGGWEAANHGSSRVPHRIKFLPAGMIVP
ncbi:piRNA biogenesis protein EXD1-like [Ornithodoros turicata]|uniref:piRNA biogenesis protein EXD1-like n=1 Tax=Ornithodoros turicata TaxID=34597 RepID=UPI003138DF33